MNILLDTNILFHLSKEYSTQLLVNTINPNDELVYTSTVSIGELKSIGMQNGWSARKWDIAYAALDKINIVEISENLVDTYAQIDAYSQRRNPSFLTYPFPTPRNMGKNDLWIAATAALLGLKLVTTDADFNHLHGEFIDVRLIKPGELMK